MQECEQFHYFSLYRIYKVLRHFPYSTTICVIPDCLQIHSIFFQNLSEITYLIDSRLDAEQPREMSHPPDETLLLAYQMRQTLCVMLLNIQASLK